MPAFNLKILLFFFTVSLSNRAGATLANYNSILIGDQAAGMGGAYTAMTEDASALAWYNPAGLAFLRGQSFSAAVGIYKKFDTHYSDNVDLTKTTLSVNQGFFRALPSSTGSIIRKEEILPNFTFALSIVVPEFDQFKGDIANTDTNTSTLSFVDESLWVGGAIAKRIDGDESIGMTAYYTARSFTRSVNDRTILNSGARKIIYNEERAYTQNGIVLQFGYHRQLSENFKMGLCARLPAIHIAGAGSYYDTLIDTSSSSQPTLNYPDLRSKTKIPARYTLGFAYRALPELVLTADGTFYGSEKYGDLEEETIAEGLENRTIWNGSLGGELHLRSWLKVRAGAFTNFSAHPNPEVGRNRGQGDKVDQLGFSANIALISGEIQYTFGGYYTGGRGRSVQRVNQEYVVIPKQLQVFTMLVGTSYSF